MCLEIRQYSCGVVPNTEQIILRLNCSTYFPTVPNPKYAVITSSEDQPEEDKMIELLDEMEIKYYLTRQCSVQIYSDKKNITINQ